MQLAKLRQRNRREGRVDEPPAAGDFDCVTAQAAANAMKFQITGLGEVVSAPTVDAAASTEGSIRTTGGLGVHLEGHIGGDAVI